jgi:hypothetical protein
MRGRPMIIAAHQGQSVTRLLVLAEPAGPEVESIFAGIRSFEASIGKVGVGMALPSGSG